MLYLDYFFLIFNLFNSLSHIVHNKKLQKLLESGCKNPLSLIASR